MSRTLTTPHRAVYNNGDVLLRVRDLTTHFRPIGMRFGGGAPVCKAVDGVSFDVHCGSTLAVVGESGCGKTTLARTIMRLVPATSGAAVFDGADLLALSGSALRRMRRRVQMVFQDPAGSLNPRMTIAASVGEPLIVHHLCSRADVRPRVDDLLARVGLSPSHADRYPHELSGGQKQRVGVARALACEPDFIVCDEPVSALDVSIQAQMLNLLKDLQADLGLTYLFISHDLAVVRHISDHVAVMYLGRIVETGPTADVFAGPSHPYTRALLHAAPSPDPARRTRRAALPGEPPSPIYPPVGCAFHPRCAYATEQCRDRPMLRQWGHLGTAHRVACHHTEKLAEAAPGGALPT